MSTRRHQLKSWPQFFNPIVAGTRTHELRRNDRDYQVGDVLELHEYNPRTATYTGAVCRAVITSITSDDTPCAVSDLGLTPGFCILSVALEARTGPAGMEQTIGAHLSRAAQETELQVPVRR